jgi:hemerythrin-like domain-containing protein
MYFKARDGFLPPGTPCDFQVEIRRQAKKEGWKMAVQIGTKPDSGFDDPIGMLKDCHRRIEHFLDILFLVAERAYARALTGEERSAVQAALQYFHVGGERHNADEEESLFPRLRDESSARSREEIARLEGDHRRAAELHESVDWLFTAWISAGTLEPEDEQRLSSQTRGLKQLYGEHIKVEEEIVFPHAAQMLDSRTIAAIGQEFRSRRS